MQDKINQFLKLQEIDTEIAEFEKSFEDLPKEISSLEKKIDFENIKILIILVVTEKSLKILKLVILKKKSMSLRKK